MKSINQKPRKIIPTYLNQFILDAIDSYCEEHYRDESFKQDMLLYTAVVFYFTELTGRDSAKIHHTVFKRIFGKRGYAYVKDDDSGFKSNIVDGVSSIEWACLAATVSHTKRNIIGHQSREYEIKPHLRESEYVQVNLPNDFLNKIKRKKRKQEEEDDDKLPTVDKNPLTIKKYDRVELIEQFMSVYKKELVIKYHDEDILNSEIEQIGLKSGLTLKQIKRAQIMFQLFMIDHYQVSEDKNGRIYSFLSFIKSEFRTLPMMEMDEVDISSSHPFFISVILWSIINNKRGILTRIMNKPVELNTNKNSRLNTVKHVLNDLNSLLLIDRHRLFLPGNKFNKILINDLFSQVGTIHVGDENNLANNVIEPDKYKIISGGGLINHPNNIKSSNKGIPVSIIRSYGVKSEVKKMLELTASGGFYDFIHKKMNPEKSPFKHFLRLIEDQLPTPTYALYKNSPEQLSVQERKKIEIKIVKMMVMCWMNDTAVKGVKNLNINYQNMIHRIFIQLFPYVTTIIELIKAKYAEGEKDGKKGKTAFNSLLTQVEAEFVFHVVEKARQRSKLSRGFKVGTVHDSFVVPKHKKEDLVNIIRISADKLLGYHPSLKDNGKALVLKGGKPARSKRVFKRAA